MQPSKLTCTICFQPAKFFRKCWCLYCQPCKLHAKQACPCGGQGGFLDLTQNFPEQIKLMTYDSNTLLKHLSQQASQKIMQAFHSTFKTLFNVLQLKNHQQTQFRRSSLQQISNLKSELQTRHRTPQFTLNDFQMTPSLDRFRYSTPRELKPVIPRTPSSRRPFQNQNFALFKQMDEEPATDAANILDQACSQLEVLAISGGWEILSQEGVIFKVRYTNDYWIYSASTEVEKGVEQILMYLMGNQQEYNQKLKNSEVIFRWGDNMKIMYQQIQFPWYASDREVIVIKGVTRTDRGVFLAEASIENERPVQRNFVRGEMILGGFGLVQKEEKVQITYVYHFNPRGSLSFGRANSINAECVEVLKRIKSALSN